jgi:TRAP-type uncharacterized transport system substrate-binding protein
MLNNTRRHISLHALALLSGLCAAPAWSAPADTTGCELRVATGPAGKVYEKLFADMRSMCGAEVSLCAVPSEGGLQNLSLLSASQADVGMAQVDTVDTMKDGDDNVRRLQAVMPLHSNMLHVVTLSAGSKVDAALIMGKPVPGTGRTVVVRNFSELKGLSIAAVGSAQLMGRTLENQLGYGMKFENVDNDDQGLARLRAGSVQAVFTTVGWPSPFISKLRDDSFMLARYDLKAQIPYQVVKRNYQNLGALNHPFLAVPNLLLSHPYKAGGTYFKRVAALQRCLIQHLDGLQEGSFHPSWKEIKDVADTSGVALFPGAAAASTQSAGAAPLRRR